MEVPERNLCCGRPYYDYGMLKPARRMLEDVLVALAPRLRDNVWVVGLEPSCLATFHEELMNFFPRDERAKRLKERSLLLSQFLTEVADYRPPAIDGRAVVHTHCYHKAIFGQKGERELLRRSGLEFELLDDGCCGMAGSFGYETHKDPISRTIAEHVLLPKVRAAGPDDLIVADGFSCREQIVQLADRRPITLAEVIAAAIDRRDRMTPYGMSSPEVGSS